MWSMTKNDFGFSSGFKRTVKIQRLPVNLKFGMSGRLNLLHASPVPRSPYLLQKDKFSCRRLRHNLASLLHHHYGLYLNEFSLFLTGQTKKIPNTVPTFVFISPLNLASPSRSRYICRPEEVTLKHDSVKTDLTHISCEFKLLSQTKS